MNAEEILAQESHLISGDCARCAGLEDRIASLERDMTIVQGLLSKIARILVIMQNGVVRWSE